MASRKAVLLVLLVAGTGLLAGCQDRLAGVGTFKVVLTMSELPGQTVGTTFYANRILNFSKLEGFILSANIKRADAEPLIPPKTILAKHDFTQFRGEELVLFDEKVVAGRLRSVTVAIATINGTLLDGREVKVNTSWSLRPPQAYEFPENATVEVAGSTTFQTTFMIAQERGGRGYFLMAVPQESGPR